MRERPRSGLQTRDITVYEKIPRVGEGFFYSWQRPTATKQLEQFKHKQPRSSPSNSKLRTATESHNAYKKVVLADAPF